MSPPRRSERASAASARAAAAAAAAAARPVLRSSSRRVVQPPPPGTRNITSRQSRLMLEAKQQFNTRDAGAASSSLLAPSAPLLPGQVLTEEEKLAREVQDLIADIGEDDRDPDYLRFLHNLDETMEEDSDEDEDFVAEEEESGDEEMDEVEASDDASSTSDCSNDGSEESDESMDDLDEAESDGAESDVEPANPARSALARFFRGDFSSDDDEDSNDYVPREVEEEEEDSSEDEQEEYFIQQEDENPAAKAAEAKLRRAEDRAETENGKLLRTKQHGQCTVCAEDTVVDPVGCAHCTNFIGCRKCANRWYRSSKAASDDEMASCPLCRQLWPGTEPDVKEMEKLMKAAAK